MTKHYVDAEGRYLGGFDGGHDETGRERTHPDVPDGAAEVPGPPSHALERWDGERWQESDELRDLRARQQIVESDADMARVIEDVVARQDAIIAALSLDTEVPDLPAEAREKITQRQALRAGLGQSR